MTSFALAIHGGCGVQPRRDMPAELARDCRRALLASLRAGHDILARRGTALDAVEAAVVAMEDSPLFNAGHGAVFNAAGGHELDAAIMDGRTLLAGAVAAARHIRNPIRAARLIMERSDHLLLAGEGADRFAEEHGLAPVPQSYFDTEVRRHALADVKRSLRAALPDVRLSEAQKHGTVGAVALDQGGNLAAATSTGGYTNKILGRVGDTPIVGAGTYANNATCAVSATGKGEFFIRKVLAHEVSARIAYRGDSLAAAADALVLKELPEWGSGAGLVAVARDGTIVMPFNTEGMYRGSVSVRGEWRVGIYDDLAAPAEA
jgi:beta-aspartyl-peptidase (threonine type)